MHEILDKRRQEAEEQAEAAVTQQEEYTVEDTED